MDKLSTADVHELLGEVPTVLRKLAAERDHYQQKCARLERRDDAEKVARSMQQKGVDMETPFETLVERLEKAAEQGKLETIQASLDLVGPDMGTKIASLSSREDRIEAGSSDFERFLVGGVG